MSPWPLAAPPAALAASTKFLLPSPTTLGNDNHTRMPLRAMPPGYDTGGHLMRAQ
ncbi:uncharacterized protein FFB14_13255 [Fusarium fujikuroi]|nr:uncharacterized protein FFB14_13255 [Fusarium fujikuroi]